MFEIDIVPLTVLIGTHSKSITKPVSKTRLNVKKFFKKKNTPSAVLPQPVAICSLGFNLESEFKQDGVIYEEYSTSISNSNKAISLYNEGGL